jgi:hypothetical protein
MIEEKTCCCVSGVVEGRHGFSPLCEIINWEENVFVSIVGWGLHVMNLMPHLQKGPA